MAGHVRCLGHDSQKCELPCDCTNRRGKMELVLASTAMTATVTKIMVRADVVMRGVMGARAPAS